MSQQLPTSYKPLESGQNVRITRQDSSQLDVTFRRFLLLSGDRVLVGTTPLNQDDPNLQTTHYITSYTELEYPIPSVPARNLNLAFLVGLQVEVVFGCACENPVVEKSKEVLWTFSETSLTQNEFLKYGDVTTAVGRGFVAPFDGLITNINTSQRLGDNRSGNIAIRVNDVDQFVASVDETVEQFTPNIPVVAGDVVNAVRINPGQPLRDFTMTFVLTEQNAPVPPTGPLETITGTLAGINLDQSLSVLVGPVLHVINNYQYLRVL